MCLSFAWFAAMLGIFACLGASARMFLMSAIPKYMSAEAVRTVACNSVFRRVAQHVAGRQEHGPTHLDFTIFLNLATMLSRLARFMLASVIYHTCGTSMPGVACLVSVYVRVCHIRPPWTVVRLKYDFAVRGLIHVVYAHIVT